MAALDVDLAGERHDGGGHGHDDEPGAAARPDEEAASRESPGSAIDPRA